MSVTGSGRWQRKYRFIIASVANTSDSHPFGPAWSLDHPLWLKPAILPAWVTCPYRLVPVRVDTRSIFKSKSVSIFKNRFTIRRKRLCNILQSLPCACQPQWSFSFWLTEEIIQQNPTKSPKKTCPNCALYFGNHSNLQRPIGSARHARAPRPWRRFPKAIRVPHGCFKVKRELRTYKKLPWKETSSISQGGLEISTSKPTCIKREKRFWWW